MARNDWMFAALGWDPEWARRVPRKRQWQLGVFGALLGSSIAALAFLAMDPAAPPVRIAIIGLIMITTIAYSGLSWIIRREVFGRIDLERDAQAAAAIQSRLIPGTLTRVPGLDMAHHYSPFRLAGGDFYDVVPAGPGRVLIAMADVSGKGTAAALITANLQAILRFAGPGGKPLGDLAAEIHTHLLHHTEPGRFVTMFLGLLNVAEGRLEFVNAGHNPPRRVGSDAVVSLGATAPPLGAFETAAHTTATTALRPGEALVLYTDGLTERRDPRGAFFGEAGIEAVLERHSSAPAAALVRELVAAADSFAKGTPADDDTAILVVRRTPPEH